MFRGGWEGLYWDGGHSIKGIACSLMAVGIIITYRTTAAIFLQLLVSTTSADKTVHGVVIGNTTEEQDAESYDRWRRPPTRG